MPKELASHPLVRELIEKFQNKVPKHELAALITRMTGLPCLPQYIIYKQIGKASSGIRGVKKKANPEKFEAARAAYHNTLED